MKNKLLYENLYSNRKFQRKVISDNNFTYRTLISLSGKYLKNNERILDIGCGIGTVDFYLCKRGHKLLGIDISKNAIEIASINSRLLGMDKNIKFMQCDIASVTNVGSYDAVIALEVLEHLKKDDGILKTLNKVCLSGTLIIASSPSKNALLYKMGLLKRFDKEVGHLRRYSEKEYIKLFESNGFEIVDLIKTEGVLRNLLFTSKHTQLLIKMIKGPLVPLVNYVDDLLLKLFGESNYYVIALKK